MSTTAITINVDDSIIAAVQDALCAANGLPVSPANAAQALIHMIRATVANVQTAQQAQPAHVQPPDESLFS